MIEFFIRLEPEPPTVTAQMHKVAVRDGKPVFYDTPALKKARALLTAHLAKFAPPSPFRRAVKLDVIWIFQTPPRGKDGFKVTKPDTDNLEKLLKDVMTTCGYWFDDAQVAVENVVKIQRASVHGINIEVTSLEERKEDD